MAMAEHRQGQTPQSRLQRTGANILQGSRPPSSAAGTPVHGAAYGASGADMQLYGFDGGMPGTPYSEGPAPPSAGRTGRLHSDNRPTLTPFIGRAENVPVVKDAGNFQRIHGPPESIPKAVWTDSVAHITDEPWPAHAVPVFLFSGHDRPRPGFREEVKFTLRDERYVNFALRLKCGTGDRYMGGTIGLVHSADRSEAVPGIDGQLVTVTDIVVHPDSSIVVSAVGDLEFKILRTWMPRGLRGLQLALVEVEAQVVKRLDPILESLADEQDFTYFARLLVDGAPRLAEALSIGGPFTVFAPTNAALDATFGPYSAELLQLPGLEAFLACHVCAGKTSCEALYSGRTLQAVDGTVLLVTFIKWPRNGPMVNNIPIQHLDIACRNGIVHSITGVLSPAPMPMKRGHR